MIEVVEPPNKRPFLRYSEDVSKNHPGGLNGRKISQKIANTTDPDRCFVKLFKLYLSLCPEDAPSDAFYLQPLKKPSPTCWFSKQATGHMKLDSTVCRLCTKAGIKGHKTNHSLRATATSRLYQAGVDEQLVMERTGHRSVEGVRSYNRTSEEQRLALSDIMIKRPRPTAAIDVTNLLIQASARVHRSAPTCPTLSSFKHLAWRHLPPFTTAR